MNPQSTIQNESEFKNFRRDIKLPKLSKNFFNSKRNLFESDPRLTDWVTQVFEYSQIDEKRFKKIRKATICAIYTWPFCQDSHRFENLVKFILTFVVLDDHTDCEWGDGARDADQCRTLWNQLILGSDKISDKNQFIFMNGWKPYTVFWFAVNEDICHDLNEVSKRRFIQTFRDMCKSQIEEIEKLNNKYVFKDLEEYFNLRRHNIGFWCCTALLDYQDNISLADDEWNDPDFKNLCLMAGEAIIYHNDMYSFEKEWVEQNKQLDQMYNVVSCIALIDKISIEAAFEKAGTLALNTEVKLKEHIDEFTKRDLSPDMKIFINRLEYLIGGSYELNKIIDRYNKIYE